MIERKVKLLYNGKKIEKTLVFKEVDYAKTKKMIVENHYSKKWNTSFGKINIGVFENDEFLGVASFGNLMNPNSYKNFNNNFTKESVIELNRLWVDDKLGGNVESVLLKSSWEILRKNHPEIKVVQSFADGRLGCGTIYKATNFNYYGFSESVFLENIDTGEVFHKVPMENTKRPDGMIKLNTLLIKNKLRPFKVKTYRYAYPLYKNIKIEMVEQPYPKYDIGFEYLDDFEIKENQVVRAYILSFLLDYPEKKDLNDWVRKNSSKDKVIEILENKSILEVCYERKIEKKLFDIKENINIVWNEILQKNKKTKQLDLFDFI